MNTKSNKMIPWKIKIATKITHLENGKFFYYYEISCNLKKFMVMYAKIDIFQKKKKYQDKSYNQDLSN
jgi:hypothetical protein